MGALTSNRKRGDDYFTFNYKTPQVPSFDYHHISKKPRLSMNQNSQDHFFTKRSSVTSRIYKYPSAIIPLKREIHAPCRPSRFKMGNFLVQQYDRAKRSAIGTLRFLKKDKEVINIDDDDDDVQKGVSEDSSSIEELDNGVVAKSGLSNGSARKWREAVVGVVAKTGIYNGSGPKWKEGSGGGGDDGVVEILDIPDDDGGGGVKNSISSVVTVSDDDVNLKVENAEKMLDSMSLIDDSSPSSVVPLYKKFYDTAQKRNDSLKRLQFDIEYTEKLRDTYRLLRPQKKEHVKEDVITEPFVPLTEEEEEEVSRALSNSNRRKVLVTHEISNIDITGELLQCLRPGAWLNDEVINVYLELLKERERREPKKFLKCHFCNTFFYKKLISGRGGYNYQSVKRWTSQRKLGYGLFECDKIFVPIHKEIHWCLAVINKKDEKFQYLDSLGGMDTQVLKVLARYFIDEVKDKNGKDIDLSSWKQEFVEDLPEQKNGFDCGMFMIKYADFYSRDIGLCFGQEHMPYFRLRTAKEILRLKAE